MLSDEQREIQAWADAFEHEILEGVGEGGHEVGDANACFSDVGIAGDSNGSDSELKVRTRCTHVGEVWVCDHQRLGMRKF